MFLKNVIEALWEFCSNAHLVLLLQPLHDLLLGIWNLPENCVVSHFVSVKLRPKVFGSSGWYEAFEGIKEGYAAISPTEWNQLRRIFE